MPQKRLHGGAIDASYSVEWQRKVYTAKNMKNKNKNIRSEKAHKRGDHNCRRVWKVHGNLSSVQGDQPWQKYDYRESGGLAGR